MFFNFKSYLNMVVMDIESEYIERVYQNHPEIIDFYNNYYVPNRINSTNHHFISFARRTPSLGFNPSPYTLLEFYLEQDYRAFCRHPNILNNIENIVFELVNNDIYNYFFNSALGIFINPYDILTDPIEDEIEVVRKYLDIALRRRNSEIRYMRNNN